MGLQTATKQRSRRRVSAARPAAGKRPDRFRDCDATAWRFFRERLKDNLEITGWFDSRSSDTVPAIVEMAQQALLAADCAALRTESHDGHHDLLLSRILPGCCRGSHPCGVGDVTVSERWERCTRPRIPEDSGEVRGPGIARPVSTTVCLDTENNWLDLPRDTGRRQAIQALASAIEFQDPYTCGHSRRVARYSIVCGLVLGLSPEAMSVLEIAAILHDVGKTGIDCTILQKPGALTAAEHALVRDHPVIGAALTQVIALPNDVIELILRHHERHDGYGYPHGLAEQDIPLGARIISVADAFDSMTTGRPYRRALSVNEAMRELLRCRGTQFHADTLDAFAIGFARYYDRLPWPSGELRSRRNPAVPA